MRFRLVVTCAAVFAVILTTVPAALAPEHSGLANASTGNSIVVQQMAALPLAFTENKGQWDEKVLFRASAGGATLWFCRDGITYQFTHRISRAKSSGRVPFAAGMTPHLPFDRTEPDSVETVVVKAAFVGAAPAVEISGEQPLDYRCNYFLGNDPSKWRTDVPNYTAVAYRNVYPGVDVKYEGKAGVLTCSYTAARKSDLEQVKLRHEGNATVTETGRGQFRVEAPWGAVLEPLSSGQAGGPPGNVVPVAASALEANGAASVTLVYGTFLGGSGDDSGYGIAVDQAGSAYVTGYTGSTDFPTQNPYDGSFNGYYDVYVTKLSPAGNAFVYSTYLGGSGEDYARGIAVDQAGNAYVTGVTYSTDFPTQNPYDDSFNGGYEDVFMTKLVPAGNALVYSTFLGGSSFDNGFGIAVDQAGSAYVTGYTRSSDFPTQNPYDGSYNGGRDVFVTKLSAAGNALVYSTFLGGSSEDEGNGIAVDQAGSAYVTGQTESADFPTLNPYDDSLNNVNAFVTKLVPAGNALVYSTFLGGSSFDNGFGIAVDRAGSAYVTGYTRSSDFPTQNPYDGTYNGGYYDVFVTKLSPAGNTLVYSTFLGGGWEEWGNGIAVDQAGSAYVTGHTYSSNFPTQNPYQGSLNGPAGEYADVFVTKLSPAGNALVYSTYLGGSGGDAGCGIAVDQAGNAYVTGATESSNFPTQNPFDSSYNGGSSYGDAFVTKLSPVTPPVAICRNVTKTADANCQAAVTPAEVDNGSTGTGITLALQPAGPYPKGTNHPYLVVTDAQNTKDSCLATIIVIDLTKPTITCPADIAVNVDPGQCGAVVSFPGPLASDNCPGVTVVSTPPSGSFFPVGVTAVSCVAADASGNKDTCQFTVTIRDVERPVAQCHEDTVVVAVPGQAEANVIFSSSANDNCPGVVVACNPPSGSFFPGGVTHVSCIATDAAGNKDTCGLNLTVRVCICLHQGDLDGSGFVDVQDVLAVIGVAFVNGTDVQDPACPKTRGDVNNNGVVDVNDVLYLIGTAFLNGPNPVNPCGP